jgi:hypothetical protein
VTRESIVAWIAESDSMRRIDTLVAHVQLQFVLACEEDYQKHYVNMFDSTVYIITSAFEAFQRGEGIQLPTDFCAGLSKEGSKEANRHSTMNW